MKIKPKKKLEFIVVYDRDTFLLLRRIKKRMNDATIKVDPELLTYRCGINPLERELLFSRFIRHDRVTRFNAIAIRANLIAALIVDPE